jgi:type VI protein secretion system component VasK
VWSNRGSKSRPLKVGGRPREICSSKPVVKPSKLTDDEEKLLEKHLNMLKAYLMLSGKYREQAQASHVGNVLRDYWVSESKTPGDMRYIAEQQLEFWAKQIDRDQFPRIPLNEKLVADTRAKLKDYPARFRYLSRKVTEISRQVDDEHGERTVSRILTDAGANTSVMTGTYRVPGAYTRAGLDLMKEAIQNAGEEMTKDDWVMGDKGGGATAADIQAMETRYYNDYALHWIQFVRATDVKPYANRAEAVNALQAFAQPDSPMKAIVKEIAKNTNLSAEIDTDGWWPWIRSFLLKRRRIRSGIPSRRRLSVPCLILRARRGRPTTSPSTNTSARWEGFTRR